MESQYDVVIVGGGPVGVGLAVELGQRGVSCVVIERHLAPQRIPKGQNLTNRSMEILDAWGCAEGVRAARVMPPGYAVGGVTAYRSLSGEHWYASGTGGSRGRAVQEFFHQQNERLPQYATEEVLRARAAQLPSVTVRLGWTAERVEQDEHGVSVTVVPTEQYAAPELRGQREVLRAAYAVGCDGGQSLVRAAMGVEGAGRNYDQRMLLAVLRSPELHRGLERFPEAATYRVLTPELRGYWQFFGRVDVGEGFFFHAPVPAEMELEGDVHHALIEAAAGFPFRAEYEYVGLWDLRIMAAERYRHGRLFIAGDAAHQHPPYGGFGLNMGLEDAANLGWKLAARVQGWGGEPLLDSYDAERRPIFEETGMGVIARGIERDAAFLETYAPERGREEFERAWGELSKTSAALPTAPYEPHYGASPVVAGAAGDTTSIHGQYAHAARPGHHLSPRLLSSGRNVFDVVGPGFTLLALVVAEADVHAVEVAAQGLGVPLTVVRDDARDDRARYEARLVLVRPDGYVAWSGDALPSAADALLERVAGRAS